MIKEGIDEKGKKLAIREKNWYKHVKDLAFDSIPQIYSYDPFVMEKIEGDNIYECDFLIGGGAEEKENIRRNSKGVKEASFLRNCTNRLF